jgi:hypothetical protein
MVCTDLHVSFDVGTLCVPLAHFTEWGALRTKPWCGAASVVTEISLLRLISVNSFLSQINPLVLVGFYQNLYRHESMRSWFHILRCNDVTSSRTHRWNHLSTLLAMAPATKIACHWVACLRAHFNPSYWRFLMHSHISLEHFTKNDRH